MRHPLVAALILLTAADPAAAQTAASNGGPDSAQRASIQASFERRPGVIRISRLGSRLVLLQPSLGIEGIRYGSVGNPRPPDANATPALVPWTEIDTLWSNQNRARAGAFTGALMVGAVIGGMSYGLGRWAEAEGGDKGVAPLYFIGGFAIGAIVGGVTGGAIGSFGHDWVMAYPETKPEPAPDRRSRRRR